jgi:hypothetical protein
MPNATPGVHNSLGPRHHPRRAPGAAVRGWPGAPPSAAGPGSGAGARHANAEWRGRARRGCPARHRPVGGAGPGASARRATVGTAGAGAVRVGATRGSVTRGSIEAAHCRAFAENSRARSRINSQTPGTYPGAVTGPAGKWLSPGGATGTAAGRERCPRTARASPAGSCCPAGAGRAGAGRSADGSIKSGTRASPRFRRCVLHVTLIMHNIVGERL